MRAATDAYKRKSGSKQQKPNHPKPGITPQHWNPQSSAAASARAALKRSPGRIMTLVSMCKQHPIVHAPDTMLQYKHVPSALFHLCMALLHTLSRLKVGLAILHR